MSRLELKFARARIAACASSTRAWRGEEPSDHHTRICRIRLELHLDDLVTEVVGFQRLGRRGRSRDSAPAPVARALWVTGAVAARSES